MGHSCACSLTYTGLHTHTYRYVQYIYTYMKRRKKGKLRHRSMKYENFPGKSRELKVRQKPKFYPTLSQPKVLSWLCVEKNCRTVAMWPYFLELLIAEISFLGIFTVKACTAMMRCILLDNRITWDPSKLQIN